MQMAAHVHHTFRVLPNQLSHTIAARLHRNDARRRIVPEPDGVVAAVAPRLVGQLHNVPCVVQRENANEIERSLRAGIQTRVDADERVAFAALVDLGHVRPRMVATLHRKLSKVVLLRLVVGNVEIVLIEKNEFLFSITSLRIT